MGNSPLILMKAWSPIRRGLPPLHAVFIVLPICAPSRRALQQ
jgi:hypothetical protein